MDNEWKVGSWLSAALDDDSVCEEMKTDIRAWFDGNGHLKAPAPSSLAGGEGSRVPTIAWALAKATCGDAPTADDFKIARCVAAALSPEAPAREGGGGAVSEAELRDAITLILPMAKGYAAAHPVGSNQSYVDYVDGLIALTPRHEAPAELLSNPQELEAPAEGAGEVWRDGPLSEALWMHFREVYGFDGDESIQSTSEIIAIIDRCARSSAPEARS